MIIAVHALLYSRKADAARAFLRNVLKLDSVDAGGGWPIFALPPAEIAVHPTEESQPPELYLVCDDVDQTVADLKSKGVEILRPISDESWGRVTWIRIPENVELGLYEPKHELAAAVTTARGRKPAAAKKKASPKTQAGER
ncbi:MAG TPA: VOC family protein [Gemmatimonadaceae bacterium]|nr:VOC family protein [Gemmatimonadaceae bacterium]